MSAKQKAETRQVNAKSWVIISIQGVQGVHAYSCQRGRLWTGSQQYAVCIGWILTSMLYVHAVGSNSFFHLLAAGTQQAYQGGQEYQEHEEQGGGQEQNQQQVWPEQGGGQLQPQHRMQPQHRIHNWQANEGGMPPGPVTGTSLQQARIIGPYVEQHNGVCIANYIIRIMPWQFVGLLNRVIQSCIGIIPEQCS